MKTKWLPFALFLQTSFSFAATSTWVGSTTAWNTASNWTPAVVPNAADATASFANGPAASVSLDANITVGTILLDSSTNYVISTPTGGGARTLTFSVATGSALITITAVNGNGAHSISGVDAGTPAITLAKPLIITQGSTGAFTISGAIGESGAQSLTKSGSGTLILESSVGNTYSGGTTITAGTLNVDSNTDNQLGTGNITLGSATLEYTNSMALTSTKTFSLTGAAIIETDSAGSVTLDGIISGAGSLQKTGSGILVLGGVNTYTGGTTISSGTITITNDNNLGASTGSLQIAGAGLDINTSGITSSRSGSFTGAATIDTGSGLSNTFSGNFSGSGTLTILGGGTMTLTGANTYSGATAMTGAGTRLIGSTGSILGDVAAGAGTFLTFNQSADGTYAGVLTGSGALTKTGTGAATFSGSSASFSGATALSQGTLIVNGSLAGSTITVASGATLGGTGTVGTTINSGTIAPGNSIGTLTVSGNLTLNASSILAVEIAPLSADLLAVTGAATLGGTLAVDVTQGFYGFSASYTVLTSAALTPPFASVTSNNAGFVPSVSYVGNNVILDINVLEPFGAFPFSNRNTEAVGNNIDALYSAGQLSTSLTSIVNSFVGQSFATINSALDQMHPAPYSAFTELQVEIDAQILSIFHRMPTLSCGCNEPYRFWLEPFGNSLTVKSHGEEVGFQANSGGVALGWDVQMENLVFGIGGAWNQNHLDWHRSQGHGTSNGYYGGLYMDCIKRQLYFGASILAGVDFYDTNRHIDFLTTNEHAKADFNALNVMGQIALAYLFGSPSAYFYPYANIDYLYLNTRRFTESGASGLDLTVHHRTSSTLRSELGLALQVQDSNMDETLCLSPKIAIGWVNMTPLQRPDFHSTFAGADIVFATYGWNETWNLLALDFGLKLAGKCFSFGVEYNVEISPDSQTLYYNQHGNVQLSWSW